MKRGIVPVYGHVLFASFRYCGQLYRNAKGVKYQAHSYELGHSYLIYDFHLCYEVHYSPENILYVWFPESLGNVAHLKTFHKVHL